MQLETCAPLADDWRVEKDVGRYAASIHSVRARWLPNIFHPLRAATIPTLRECTRDRMSDKPCCATGASVVPARSPRGHPHHQEASAGPPEWLGSARPRSRTQRRHLSFFNIGTEPHCTLRRVSHIRHCRTPSGSRGNGAKRLADFAKSYSFLEFLQHTTPVLPASRSALHTTLRAHIELSCSPDLCDRSLPVFLRPSAHTRPAGCCRASPVASPECICLC